MTDSTDNVRPAEDNASPLDSTQVASSAYEADAPAADDALDKQPSDKASVPSISRRSLLCGIGGIAALMALGGGIACLGSQPAVRPPGGQDENRLFSLCVRCQKCFEVCPHDIIKPAHIEQGVLGVRTPTLSFSEKWCDWCAEENGGVPKCVEVCPTGALQLPDGATEESTILGRAVITQDWCLAYKLIGCQHCYDACPFDAIELDAEGRPTVIEDRCNGCGACEAACVSLSNGSIVSGATHRAIIVEPIER